MRFAIENGVPYLISNGRAYPVEIKDGTVTYDESKSSIADVQGSYTLQEVIAKLGDNVTAEKKKTRKKSEE